MTHGLHLELVQTSGDLPTALPVHTLHELVYVLTPGYRVRMDGRIRKGHPGDLFFYPRGRAHTPLLKNDLKVRFYCIQWQDEKAVLHRYPPQLHDATGRLLLLFQWMWELFPARGAEERRLLQALWTAAQAEHRRLALTVSVTFADRVRHYMARDLHRPLTLLEIASAEGVSTFHLIRRFRRETGQTPGQHLRQLRVQRALSLLTTTTIPIKEVARAVGFSSATHLAALIRRATGRTPGSFRNAVSRAV